MRKFLLALAVAAMTTPALAEPVGIGAILTGNSWAFTGVYENTTSTAIPVAGGHQDLGAFQFDTFAVVLEEPPSNTTFEITGVRGTNWSVERNTTHICVIQNDTLDYYTPTLQIWFQSIPVTGHDASGSNVSFKWLAYNSTTGDLVDAWRVFGTNGNLMNSWEPLNGLDSAPSYTQLFDTSYGADAVPTPAAWMSGMALLAGMGVRRVMRRNAAR